MPDEAPPKGFWASLADGLAKRREERQRRREEFGDNFFKFLAAGAVLTGKLPEDIDKALGPEGKVALANDLLQPGSIDERLAELKRQKAEQDKARQAAVPPSPEEKYRREAEREMQMHFGKKAAYQAAGQRRIAEFLEKEAANLSAEEVKRQIQNINDWVQRKCDEL